MVHFQQDSMSAPNWMDVEPRSPDSMGEEVPDNTMEEVVMQG